MVRPADDALFWHTVNQGPTTEKGTALSGQAVMEMTVETLTDAVEVAVLSPTHTIGDVESACEEAAREHLAAVCVAPYVVGRASRALRGTHMAICGAVGYPFGYADGLSKCREVGACLEAGVRA